MKKIEEPKDFLVKYLDFISYSDTKAAELLAEHYNVSRNTTIKWMNNNKRTISLMKYATEFITKQELAFKAKLELADEANKTLYKEFAKTDKYKKQLRTRLATARTEINELKKEVSRLKKHLEFKEMDSKSVYEKYLTSIENLNSLEYRYNYLATQVKFHLVDKPNDLEYKYHIDDKGYLVSEKKTLWQKIKTILMMKVF